jgi:hypothetical protein
MANPAMYAPPTVSRGLGRGKPRPYIRDIKAELVGVRGAMVR